MRWKKDVTDTPKITKIAIGRRGAEKTLIGSATLKNSSRGLAIYEKNSRRNHLSPEMRSKHKRDQKSTYERSQECGDAFAQQHHSEHEH
jgi:hypothetical protein